MKKEDLKEIIELREKIDGNLKQLGEALKRGNKKWIKSDIEIAIAHLAILSKKADISTPNESLDEAKILIELWKREREKNETKHVDTKKLYGIWAKKYDSYKNLATFLEEKIVKRTLNFKNKEILDLGCGTGRYAISLAKKNNVTAVDFSKEMLDVAKKKAKKEGVKVDFVKSDLKGYFPNKKFDVIISMLVQDHIKNLKDLRKLMKCASKIGTEIIISNIHPCHTYKTSIGGNKAKILTGYTAPQYYHPLEEYLELLRPLGFELVYYKDLIFTEEYARLKQFTAQRWLKDMPIVAFYRFKRLK